MRGILLSLAAVCAAAPAAMAQDSVPLDLSIMYNKGVMAHLIFMVLTFLVLVPAAILIARFGRTYFNWFPHHRNIQLLAVVFIVIGFALGVSAAKPSPLNEETHYQVGVAVFILFFFQVILGLITHEYKKRSGKRWLGYVHAPLGLIIFGLAVWNMETGWNIWASGYVAGAAPRDVIYAWMGLLVLLYLIGLALLPREKKHGEAAEKVQA
jgi:cytochrome b561